MALERGRVPGTGLPVRARSSASKSDVGSVVSAPRSDPNANIGHTPQICQKKDRELLDTFVFEALKGDSKISAATRGGPLWLRQCQVCKDVARVCSQDINCKFLTNNVDAHLLSTFPKRADPVEIAGEAFRHIKELGANQHIRAMQVLLNPQLNPKSNVILEFAKRHNLITQKLEFMMQKVWESKTVDQVRGEVPIFLDGIKADRSKPEVDKMVDQYKMLSDFQETLGKERMEAANNKDEKKKQSLHGDAEIVDKYFRETQRGFKGDRKFMSTLLLMSCKHSPG